MISHVSIYRLIFEFMTKEIKMIKKLTQHKDIFIEQQLQTVLENKFSTLLTLNINNAFYVNLTDQNISIKLILPLVRH